MQAGGQAQGSSSGIAQKDATQNPPQAGVPITNTARGRTRSIVAGRRTSSSAPASPNVDRADALDADHLPPPQPAVDLEDPGALEEDKRRRNTAASGGLFDLSVNDEHAVYVVHVVFQRDSEPRKSSKLLI
jgi:hypothetical protein